MEELVPRNSAIDQYFFTPLYRVKNIWSVVGWWESRRLLYNSVVGGAGLVTLSVVALLGNPPFPALIAIPLVYGFMANVCYSFGSIADLLLRRWLGHRADAIGPVLLRYGFAFSIGLTLFPIPIITFAWLMKTFFGR
jgi:hypothetical protein